MSPSDPDYTCRQADDDLRTAQCSNKNNQSVIEIMKTEIECGWSSASRVDGFALLIALSTAFFVLILQ